MKILQPGHHTIQVNSVETQRNREVSVFRVLGRITVSDRFDAVRGDDEVLCYIWGSADTPAPTPGESMRVETHIKKTRSGREVNVTQFEGDRSDSMSSDDFLTSG